MTFISVAASWLFVSGDQPHRFDKAVASGAHEVILDLEDGVVEDAKSRARDSVAGWLAAGNAAWVRTNSFASPWFDDDLTAISHVPSLRGVVLPKAESAAHLGEIQARLSPQSGIVALIETARGVVSAHDIAAVDGVRRLAFGSIDYLLDIDAADTPPALAYARGALVVAARAAGLPGPVDGVTPETRNAQLVSEDAKAASQLGFTGKLCIHPAQVATVNAAFMPTIEQVAWADEVFARAPRDSNGQLHEGAFDLDGRMVDKPVIERARRIRARANPSEPAPEESDSCTH